MKLLIASTVIAMGLGAVACTSSGNTERGALGGALLGGAAGAIIGNNTGSGDAGQGAAIGAATGAIAGGVVGAGALARSVRGEPMTDALKLFVAVPEKPASTPFFRPLPEPRRSIRRKIPQKTPNAVRKVRSRFFDSAIQISCRWSRSNIYSSRSASIGRMAAARRHTAPVSPHG